VAPWLLGVAAGELADRAADAVRREAATLDGGRLGVLVPPALLDEVARAVTAAVPGAAVGTDADLESPVVVLTVRQAKGLEFDSVVVVDPGGIAAGSAHGPSDLYVALTRPTQRLGIVHAGSLPAELVEVG
jgi:hypothetical protein